MKVRTTKTASGKTAVQVIERSYHTTSIIKHIGSAKDRQELDALVQLAHQYIRDQNQTTPLFPQFDLHPQEQHLIAIENLEVTKTYHHFAYEFFSFFYERIGFHLLGNAVLKDLAIIRLIEPASKIASIALLQEYFDITHGHDKLYNSLRAAVTHKDRIEEKAITYAKQYLAFDFSIVFYDVTTLYFETFTEDADRTDEKGLTTVGMRKNGLCSISHVDVI